MSCCSLPVARSLLSDRCSPFAATNTVAPLLQDSPHSASSNHTGTPPPKKNSIDSLHFSFKLSQIPQPSLRLPARHLRNSKPSFTKLLPTTSQTSSNGGSVTFNSKTSHSLLPLLLTSGAGTSHSPKLNARLTSLQTLTPSSFFRCSPRHTKSSYLRSWILAPLSQLMQRPMAFQVSSSSVTVAQWARLY